MLPDRRSRALALVALSIFFVVAGANHFINPDFYVRIMPPQLPAPRFLVHLSGFFEIVGGLAVMVPKVRPIAGWGLILLLLAVFPANIHMALHPVQFPEVAPVALWLRLPIQGLLVAWVYGATRRPPTASES